MYIVNNKIDFTLIKFPIIFPLIYFFILNLTPQYETYLIGFTILLLAEPHFGATWLLYFNKVNKTHFKENKINLIYFPILIFIFTFLVFFFFKEITLLIFYAANIFHVTRQSVGISNFYKVNMEDLNLQKNIIYFFNFIFFVVGYLRFYIQIIEETIVLNTTIIMLICLSLIYYFSKIRNLKNFLL